MYRVAVLVLLAGCGRFGFGARETAVDAASGSGGDGGIDAPDRPNRIFMSSSTHDGNLGGLAGADAFCQTTADGATLGGTWRAVLWTVGAPPSTHVTGSRGWVDLQGLAIADQPADLDAATINPLRVDERGAMLTATTDYAFFGGMVPASDTCVDWTSNAPSTYGIHVVSSEESFDTDTYSDCPATHRVICAEVGHVAAVQPPQETGRVAFITTNLWVPSGGLAGADAQCQGEAGTAGLTGTYLAFLPTAAATAESRFSTTGLPWRRVDGVRIVATAADLVGSSPVPIWKSFIGRTASGAETKQRVWTGTQVQNCNDWNGGTSQVGSIGESQSARRSLLQLFPGVGCASASPLICLQQ